MCVRVTVARNIPWCRCNQAHSTILYSQFFSVFTWCETEMDYMDDTEPPTIGVVQVSRKHANVGLKQRPWNLRMWRDPDHEPHIELSPSRRTVLPTDLVTASDTANAFAWWRHDMMSYVFVTLNVTTGIKVTALMELHNTATLFRTTSNDIIFK